MPKKATIFMARGFSGHFMKASGVNYMIADIFFFKCTIIYLHPDIIFKVQGLFITQYMAS